MHYWAILFAAGILETGWAIGLKYTDGFSRLWPSLWTAAAIAASMLLLSIAARGIPIGTAYIVWVGIGALGTVLAEWIWLEEPVSLPRMFFAALLLAAIVGLKSTSSPPADANAPAAAAQGLDGESRW